MKASHEVAGMTTNDGMGLLDVAVRAIENIRLLVIGPLAVGAMALGVAFVLPPTYTSRTTFLPPQQQQSAAASALASLGGLAGLIGGSGGIKSPADQYVSLMRSDTVSDRLIDRFGLMKVYEAKYRADARSVLKGNVRINLNKKDGLITVEVDDPDAKRAADLANGLVQELRRLTSELSLTEAQQRRQFFEQQLQQTRDQLAKAQTALQESGFTAGTLRAEPKAAAEGYAKLRAEVTAAEVRLQTLRRHLLDSTPEVQQQQAAVAALRGQVSRLEATTGEAASGPDYIDKYREYKYQETLFDLFARQYELARLDESREGALVQVVDPATPPEKRSKPWRSLIAVAGAASTFLVLCLYVLARDSWRRAAAGSGIARLRAALGRR